MDAERLRWSPRAVLGREQLGHAGLDVVALAGVLQPGRVDHQQVRGLDLGGHLGELERDRLVVGDRLAERLALLGVGDAELERAEQIPQPRAATLTRPTSTPSIIW